MSVSARLDIEIFVDCPKCDYMIDLVAETDLNEEGWLLGQACGNGCWMDLHKAFECKVTCPKCETEFDVKTIEW